MINFLNLRRSTASMLQTFNKTLLKGVLMSLGLTIFVPATAQDSDKGISSIMDEVVVTARKREESVQDTPIAVSAFTGASLDARGIESIDSLDNITPNMEFRNVNTNGGGGSNASIYIRGVGQTDFVPSADPGVGVYVDGVYVARSIGAVLDLIDVDRVEVLRGPQGTLFGRNTTGGAVAIHSQKPHEEFEGKLRVRTGSFDKLDVLGKVNGALADNVFGSLTLASLNQDGYIVNPDTGLDVGDTEKMAGRAALRWLVNDDLEINIQGDYTRIRENGQASVSTLDPNRVVLLEPGSGGFNHNFLTGPLGPPINNPGVSPFIRTRNDCDAVPGSAASLGGTLPSCANASTVGLGTNNSTLPTFFDANIWGVSGTIDWDINDNIKIKSITAYRDLESEFSHDGDSSPFNLSWVRDFYHQDQFSQEIQIQGVAFDDRLNWIIGAYYFEEDGLNYNPVDFANIDIESGGFFDHNSKAVFAQGTFDVTDKLHVTAGIRYTKDTKDFIVKDFIFTGSAGVTTPGQFVVLQSAQPTFAPPGFVLRLVNPDTYTLTADDWSPMINIAYDWNDELMTYATYSEGFKSGGVQQRIAGPVGFAPTYDPEFVESYEVGFKYNNEAGSFTLNVSAFYVDYTDIQLETIDPNGGIAPQLQNSGIGEVKGFEVEMRTSPLDTWFVEASLGYLDTEITEADATQVGGPATGDRFPLVSKWSGAVAVIKEIGLGNNGSLTPRVDYSYRTKVLFSPDNNPRNVQQSYGLMNASIGWRSADDKYSLDLRVDNIFDKYYLNYSDQSPSSATQLDLVARERQWGLMAEYRF
jgi:iron complex outermembrane recepter protein